MASVLEGHVKRWPCISCRLELVLTDNACTSVTRRHKDKHSSDAASGLSVRQECGTSSDDHCHRRQTDRLVGKTKLLSASGQRCLERTQPGSFM